MTRSDSSSSKPILTAGILSAALLACVVAALYTGESNPGKLAGPARPATALPLPVDDKLLRAAQQLASEADTAGEQALARNALHLADHELDEAFAMALSAATSPVSQTTPELKKAAERISRLRAHMAQEQDKLTRLSKLSGTNEDTADEIALSKAKLALFKDEMDDAQGDLDKLGGDKHSELERLLQQHEAAQHASAAPAKSLVGTPPAAMFEQMRYWLTLRNRSSQIAAAQKQADDNRVAQARLHEALEKALGPQPAARASGSGSEDEDTAIAVARLSNLSVRVRTLAAFDRRIQDSKQLAETYRQWSGLLEKRRLNAAHALFTSLCWIMAILLSVFVLSQLIQRALAGSHENGRRRRQLRVMTTIAAQVLGAVAILFVLFGPPTQLSTIIGFATAGVTVVLKDFIVSFFGWFVLMGKNGIHVGDWVEIEGVGGEVIEIGFLKTVLLEVGNWTDRGHPTGRRVSFVNSFAIEGHYFNFSTSDQWLWDQLTVALPSGSDPYRMAQKILEAVQKTTETDAGLAEQEWQRVTRKYGSRTFSAKPAVDIRPSSSGQGLDVHVRYITRAPMRYEVKSRLFESVVELLHGAPV